MARFRLIVLPVVFALAFCAQNIMPARAQSSLASGLIACWDMTEPSGPRADATSNNNHLTDNNTVGSVAGLQGVAASFVSASSEYLSVPLASAPLLKPGPGGAFTITGWVYRTNTATVPLYANQGTNTDFVIWYASGASAWRFQLNVSQPDQVIVTGTAGSTNTWQFVQAWYDGAADVAGFQLDAGTVYTASTASMTLTTQATNAYVGRRSSEYMQGYIDTVTIHNRVLSQSERTELYNSGSGVTCESIVSAGESTVTGPLGYAYEVDLPSGETGYVEMYAIAGDVVNVAATMGVGAVILFYVLYRLAYNASRR